MWIKIILIVLACIYLAFNILVSKLYTAKEMKAVYIDGQCMVGKIFANIFYTPSWVLKGLKSAIIFLVA